MKRLTLKVLATVDVIVSGILFFGALGLFFGGILVFGFQCYVWLRYGYWMPISVIDGASVIGVRWGWLYNPSDFIGLHKIIASIPASIALSLSAIIPGTFFSGWAESSPFTSR